MKKIVSIITIFILSLSLINGFASIENEDPDDYNFDLEQIAKNTLSISLIEFLDHIIHDEDCTDLVKIIINEQNKNLTLDEIHAAIEKLIGKTDEWYDAHKNDTNTEKDKILTEFAILEIQAECAKHNIAFDHFIEMEENNRCIYNKFFIECLLKSFTPELVLQAEEDFERFNKLFKSEL